MKTTALLLFLGIALHVHSQDHQNIEMAKLQSGNFEVHKVVDKGFQDYKFEPASKPWPVEFIKDGESVSGVKIMRAGIIEEKYEADLPAYPAYYQAANTSIVITAVDGKIYYYSWSVKTGAKIEYILAAGKPQKYADEKKSLDNYRTAVKEKQVSARSERIVENATILARELKENTLEGKSIRAIRMKAINPPTGVGLLTVVAVGIEVELTDGVILKTKNLGGKTPYTDFESSVKGGDFAGGDFKVANDSRQIPNDKIEIAVWSKFDTGKTTGTFTHPINYRSDLFYNYQGAGGSFGRGATVGVSQHGGDGSDGRSVSIRVEPYKLEGEVILKLTLSDAITGQLLTEAKVNVLNKITLNASGGNGGDGASGKHTHGGNGGNGGHGGRGGNVSLSGSGVALLKIDVQNKGGKAGNGGEAKVANINTRGTNGSRGQDGTLVK